MLGGGECACMHGCVPSTPTPPRPTRPAHPAGATPEQEDAELQRAIGQLAELALLGSGSAGDLYPDSLDEMYAAAADEAPFRVML